MEWLQEWRDNTIYNRLMFIQRDNLGPEVTDNDIKQLNRDLMNEEGIFNPLHTRYEESKSIMISAYQSF